MPLSLEALANQTVTHGRPLLAVNPLTPLLVGDMAVGWVAPHHLDWDDEDDIYTGAWFIVVGDNAYRIDFNWFERQCNNLGLETPSCYYPLRDCQADIFFNMPVGAVDISDDSVDYTELTTENLRAAISNIESVWMSDIQSRLNNAEIHEAYKIYGELLLRGYPHTASLNWRGTPMRVKFDQILRDSAAD